MFRSFYFCLWYDISGDWHGWLLLIAAIASIKDFVRLDYLVYYFTDICLTFAKTIWFSLQISQMQHLTSRIIEQDIAWCFKFDRYFHLKFNFVFLNFDFYNKKIQDLLLSRSKLAAFNYLECLYTDRIAFVIKTSSRKYLV